MLRALVLLLFALPVLAGDALLSWTEPTQNTDNSPYTDPSHYEIHHGCQQSGQYDTTVGPVPLGTSYNITGLPDFGVCYFAMQSVNQQGVASANSAEVSHLMGTLRLSDPVENLAVTWQESTVPVLVQSTGAALAVGATASFTNPPTSGNLLIAATSHRKGAQVASLPGWTKILQLDVLTGNSNFRRAVAVFAKIAGPGESQSVGIGWNSSEARVEVAAEFSAPSPWNDPTTAVYTVNDNGSNIGDSSLDTGTTASTSGQLGISILSVKNGFSPGSSAFSAAGWTLTDKRDAQDTADSYAVSIAMFHKYYSDTGPRSAILMDPSDINNYGLTAAIVIIGY